MSNIATTIEQSKHLLELGLDPKTADCMWLVTSRARLHVLDGEPISNYDRWENYPAWSLSALLEVMPNETRLLKAADNGTYLCDIRGFSAAKWYDNPIDAVFFMIVYLLEQGLIEKGGQNAR